MPALGRSRQRLASVLNTAYAEGLLSSQTHAHRLGLLFEPRLVDPHGLVGDLTIRRGRSRPLAVGLRAWAALVASARGAAGPGGAPRKPLLLVLERVESERLLLGRHPACDVVLGDATVSRRHAQLMFRDGAWVLQDLASTNGTRVNGQRVGRTTLRAGDTISLGDEAIQVD
jgi:hypothetical protein